MRFAAFLCLMGRLLAADLWVAPGGNDAAAGTREAPLRTLEAARDRLRRGGGTVWLKPGVYQRSGPLELTAADSGTRWRSAEGGEVRISAGVLVPAAETRPVKDPAIEARLDPAARGHVVAVDLAALGIRHRTKFPDLFGDGGGILQVYAGGRRLPLSRWPNQGYATMARVVDNGDWSRGAARHGGTFVYSGNRPERWLKALPGGVWLDGFWRVPWISEKVRVQSIDTTDRTITQAVPVDLGIGSKYARPQGDGKEPWYVLNLLEEIDTPGEWCLDFGAGILYLWPPAEGPVIIADEERPLISIQGGTGIRIEGLTFEFGLGNGVEITGGADHLIAGATFRNLGGNGVVVRGGTHHGVQSSDFSGLGKGGVWLGGGDRKTLTPARHFVVNSYFHHLNQVVKTYAPAIDISFGREPAVGMHIAHNLIHDLPHAAVLYSGNDHLIELNEVHNVALDSGDVGAFYTTNDWTSRGNVLRHNYVHHASGANAFYLDDGDCGDSVLENVVYRTSYGPFIGGGHDNIVRGNVIVEARRGLHLDDRGIARHYDTSDKHKMALLAGVDYRSPPWSTRYPELLKILEHPELPTGNILEDNTLIDCPVAFDFAKDVSRNTIRNNRVLAGAGDFRKMLGAIPFASIGLYTDEYRKRLPTVAETGGDSDHRERQVFDSDTDRRAPAVVR